MQQTATWEVNKMKPIAKKSDSSSIARLGRRKRRRFGYGLTRSTACGKILLFKAVDVEVDDVVT